jgi:hypothetical protein
LRDIKKVLSENARRSDGVKNRIVEVCRHLEPQLRDANQHHAADRIAALLSEYDAIEAETHAAVMSDPKAAMEALMDALERRSQR